MYRFAKDLDLSILIGRDLNQICVGRHDIQFRFSPDVSISLQSRATVLHDGKIAATWVEDKGWSSTGYHKLLNQTVISARVESESMLEIVLSDHWQLQLFDESDQYESMTLCGLYEDDRIVVV
jgi:hypothetical protein